MNWTKEIPAVDGYYWVRDKHGISLLLRESVWFYNTDGSNPGHFKEDADWEFYGPMEEPK